MQALKVGISNVTLVPLEKIKNQSNKTGAVNNG